MATEIRCPQCGETIDTDEDSDSEWYYDDAPCMVCEIELEQYESDFYTDD
jgi:hypothetical protein